MLRSPAMVLLLFIVPGCASAPAQPAKVQAETRVEIDETGRMIFIGSITKAAVAEAMEIYATAQIKPEVLAITSSGGDIVAGLDLGEWVLQNELVIEVEDFCASSCANYVFVAGREKRLHRKSILLWHGSSWQKSFDKWADPSHAGYKFITELRERESQFFDMVGVDNLITVQGDNLRPRLKDMLRWLIRRRTQGFDYNLEDLRRLGVSNIHLVDSEWDWRNERSFPVRRVSLDKDYEFTLSRFQDPAHQSAHEQ